MKIVHRILWVFAAVALALVGIVAILYGIEDWRGAHAWAACRQDLEARGEHLDASASIPPAIPDDKNLAMAPLFVRMFGYRVNPATGVLTFPQAPSDNALKQEAATMPYGSPHGTSQPRYAGDWATGQPLDLAGWQEYYRHRPDFPHAAQPQSPAEDVLLALTRYDPILDELAQAAASRPQTRFPIDWTLAQPAMIALPHYNALQFLTSTLRLRIAANLALGRNDAALRDMALARRLIGITAADPVIIAQLVSVTQLGFVMQPVWEGLRARRWSGAELQRLKTGLGGLDYLSGYRATMRWERAFFLVRTLDYFKAHGGVGETLQGMQGGGGDDLTLRSFGWMINVGPGGWFDQNKAIGCQFFQDHQIDVVDPKAHRLWLAQAGSGAAAAQGMPITPHTWLVHIMVPVYDSVLVKMAAYQADVDHAVIACALEQFYLDRHAYPARLADLIPAYLDHVPPDVIDGQPTRYRQTPDGRYLLYSIGWNGRDDGGQIAWQQGAKRDNRHGDWVWQYEPLQPPDKIQRNK